MRTPPKSSMSERIFFGIYGALILGVEGLGQLLSLGLDKVAAFFQGKKIDTQKLTSLAEKRGRYKKCVLYYCSSAGEYEQAKPLIDRLRSNTEIYQAIIFFSQSGVKFASIRGESIDYLMGPIDRRSYWQRVFEALQPNVTVVVRHELWPVFLSEAARRSHLILINATLSPAVQRSYLWRSIKSKILPYFESIHVVNQGDYQQFVQDLHCPPGQIFISGDTKYDRVVERALEKKGLPPAQRSWLEECFGTDLRLIVGSGWEPDIEVTFESLRVLKLNGQHMGVVIAPHDISKDRLRWLESRCREFGFSYRFWSDFEGQDTTPERGRCDVLIINKIGILSELYRECSLAFVGGAMHDKIHNILEPACYGLAIAHGPRFQNSREAVELVECRLTKVVQNSAELTTWLLEQLHQWKPVDGLKNKILSMTGASQRIANLILNELL